MKLSAQEEYGLRCLLQVAGHPEGGEPLTIERIAELEGLTAPYVGKLMRPLVRARLVVSHRGQRGGYRLARPADEITLLEVFGALGGHFFEPDTCDTKFSGAESLCVHTVGCTLRHFLRQVENAVEGMMGGVTLANFVAPAGLPAPRSAAPPPPAVLMASGKP
jgi:Rrf2 family protein